MKTRGVIFMPKSRFNLEISQDFQDFVDLEF